MATIVVGVDLDDMSKQALDGATALAVDLGARLVIVHAARASMFRATGEEGPMDPISHVLADTAAQEAHTVTEEWAGASRQAGADVEARLIEDDAADALIRVAEETQAAMIVVGAKNRGAVAEALLGSVAESVIRRSECPVLVVPWDRTDEAGVATA